MPKRGTQFVKLFTVITDCQDGGFNAEAFTSEEDRLRRLAERLSDDWDKKTGKTIVKPEHIAEITRKIDEQEWDDYEDGYLDEVTVAYKIVDGKLTFPDGLYFHGGQ